MANIYDVANELSRTLRDLPEYKAVVESKQAIEANPEAKTLFDEYVAFQNQLQGLMQSGQLPTEAVQQEMKDYMEKIQASPIVNEFFTKQQQLSILQILKRSSLSRFKIYTNKNHYQSCHFDSGIFVRH